MGSENSPKEKFIQEIELAKLQARMDYWNAAYTTGLTLSLSLLIVAVTISATNALENPYGASQILILVEVVMIGIALSLKYGVMREDASLEQKFAKEFEKIYNGDRVEYYKVKGPVRKGDLTFHLSKL